MKTSILTIGSDCSRTCRTCPEDSFSLSLQYALKSKRTLGFINIRQPTENVSLIHTAEVHPIIIINKHLIANCSVQMLSTTGVMPVSHRKELWSGASESVGREGADLMQMSNAHTHSQVKCSWNLCWVSHRPGLPGLTVSQKETLKTLCHR